MSLVARALQEHAADHSARLNKLNHLIELKLRSTQMESRCIAITDGSAEAGLHFSVQSEFSVHLFVLNTYDDNNTSAHEFIHIADIKVVLVTLIFPLPTYESPARGCTIVN